MAVAPYIHVASPTITPSRYGLATAADLVVESNPKLRNGVEFEANPTGPAKLSRAECAPPNDPPEFDSGIDIAQFDPLVVYRGFTCSPVGLTEDDILDQARRALAGGEWAAVEKALWAGDYERPLMDTPTDILTTTAVSLVKGVGLLEETLAEEYGGVGIIHAPRHIAGFAAEKNQVDVESGRKVTTLGTRWSFGVYPNTGPDTTAADVDTAWLVATGAMQIRRTDVTYRSIVDVRGGARYAIAERTYVPAWEGPQAAVLVTLT